MAGDYAMSGLMEILIIVAIILGIFILPGRLRRQPEPEAGSVNPGLKLNGWERMAILASFLWLAFFLLYLRPWNSGWRIFIYLGLSPVLISWGIFWIFLGFKKRRR
jgi:hypothetical protein